MENRTLMKLDRGLLRLMQIRGAIAGSVLLAAAAVGEAWVDRLVALPFGLLLGAGLLLLIYLALIAPPRRYRAWAYGMDRDELQVRRGVWTRVQTVVPLDHVQHIDVSQGPLERAFGICSLVLHTAGTLHSQIVLPGLTRATAEGMRDEIRGRMREEPA
ncbi:MAG TPA: PH domain-containing protein [Allosphingosinicella sp.]|nr:PH domain-containing protein [Allosphingosinicella sp.]